MAEGGRDLKQQAKSLVDQAKRTVGVGEAPLATEVGGRVAAVREALRAFGEGEMDRFMKAFAEEVEWVGPKGAKFPGAGTYKGRQAVGERFVGDVKRSYATFGFRPERYLEAPEENLVVILGAFVGEGVKGSGSGQLEAPSVQVWQFDGDKVTRVQIYADAEAFPETVSEEEEAKQEREEEEGQKDAGKAEHEGAQKDAAKAEQENGEKDGGKERQDQEEGDGHKEDGK